LLTAAIEGAPQDYRLRMPIRLLRLDTDGVTDLS
jgi:hypothetical protein